MALCYLCRIPEIDNTYANLLDFDSVTSLKNFISSRTVYSLGEYNIKYDGNIPVIDVQKPYDTLLQIDYLYMIKDNIYTCYFVIKKEMHASNITRLYLELDVWMTNMHKVEFMTSFIDRCHVHRWTQEGYPTKEIVSEPVALGVDVVDGIPTQKARTDNGVYIYITSSPVGAITTDKSSGGGSDDPSGPDKPGCGDPEQGIPTPNGFVFIKGYEGLAQYAYDIGDGHQTIGYGCTQANWPTYFNQLVNNQPVSEQLASEVFASLLITEFGIPLKNQLQSDGILNKITGDQFSALLSFAYNAGLGSLQNAAFYDLIVQGDYDLACTYWLTTNILPGTQFEEGLRARRQAEVNIFKNGVYDLRTILIYGASGNVTGHVTENDGKGYIPSIIANTCSQGGDYNYFEDSDGNLWSLPLEKGWTSALFGSYPEGGAHYGIDFTWQTPGTIKGANIYAPNDNMTVVFAGWNSGGFGNMVKLYDSITDTYHIFGHMDQTPNVSTGDTVNRKTILGYVGTTGNSTGYHLHWEVRKGVDSSSNAINPIANSELYTWYYRKGDGN